MVVAKYATTSQHSANDNLLKDDGQGGDLNRQTVESENREHHPTVKPESLVWYSTVI